MRSVIFIGAGDQGSYQMRGIQATQALEKYHNLKVPYVLSSQILENIDNVKNYILVFIGEPIFHCRTLDNLIKLSKHNILVYDVVDNFCFDHTNPFVNDALIEAYKYLNVLIHPNSYSKTKAENIFPNMNHILMPHQWDIRNENIILSNIINTNKSAYIGDVRGFTLNRENLKDYVNVYNEPLKHNDKHSLYSVHISFRNDGSNDYLYKPCTKLAISSCFKSILLCNNEESINDIVGDTYPFYIKSEQDVINKMDWIKGMTQDELNRHREDTLVIKDYLSPKQTSNRYIDLFKLHI